MVRVEWCDGTWNGKWKTYKYWEGRRKVVWEEDLDKPCIVFKKVCFTHDYHLDSNTRKELRISYLKVAVLICTLFYLMINSYFILYELNLINSLT